MDPAGVDPLAADAAAKSSSREGIRLAKPQGAPRCAAAVLGPPPLPQPGWPLCVDAGGGTPCDTTDTDAD